MKLAGRRALVTGAQQGIGRATALALAAAGADVAVNWLDGEAAAGTLAGEIKAMGRRSVTVQGSVASRAEIDRFVECRH